MRHVIIVLAAGLLLTACQTPVNRKPTAALRMDGSYFSDGVANTSATGPAVRNAFRIYRDFEAVYISTTGEPEMVDQGSLRAYRELGSGGCLLDGPRIDCRFVQDARAWVICGETLTDAVSLSVSPIDPRQENPAKCPTDNRRVFRFVPQR